MPPSSSSIRAETRWAVRIIPCCIFVAFGFATYAVVAHICIDYLYNQRQKKGVAIALLVLYFLTFILTLLTYTRTYLTAKLNPGLVPLSAEREEAIELERKRHWRHKKSKSQDIEATTQWTPRDDNPDSPGLEAFYSKDVFICENDGRPKWCSECSMWKPDRAHHSSDLGRCARKMDHVCVWTGGLISETSFNFFVQFTFYCSMYCAICLSTSAYCLRLKNQEGRPLDGFVLAAIVISAFFQFFSFAMFLTAGRFVLRNITNIDMLRKSQVYQLAVRVPLNSPSTDRYSTVSYPLARPMGPNYGPGVQVGGPGSRDHMVSTRDRQATRTFAILRTEPGENPWDAGIMANFKSVMGSNVIEWLLPIRHSPCCNHDSMVSDYSFGPLLDELKRRYGIPDCDGPETRRVEMRQTGVER